MKEELKKYIKNHGLNLTADEDLVMEYIDDFFGNYQPERSKREDACKECEEEDHVWTWLPKGHKACMRCGALNSMET